jgi:hypothetical protein
MGKVWVLDTSTKGTGAEMVPLEKVLVTLGPEPQRAPVLPRPSPRLAREPEPRPPNVFKVVDVMTQEVLTEGVRARAALDLLAEIRSVVDVTVYAWDETAQQWQLLSLGEKKLMWTAARARRAGSEALAAPASAGT